MSTSAQQIEQEVVSRFVKNLEFFKEHEPELFQKVELLSNAINDGLYKEQYALEYVQQINDFDIVHLETQTYLYNKNFSQFNQDEIQTLNLNKSKIFSNLNRKFYKQVDVSYELPLTKYKLLDEYLEQDISNMSALFKDITYSNKYKYVDKMLFLGTLLGKHIETGVKKVLPKLCLIIEPNLELFRLSLFICDYTSLAQKSHLIFSVMDEQAVLMHKLDLFISQHFQFSNYNIKYSKVPHFSDDLVHAILTKLHLENPFIFDYTKVLYDTVYFATKHISKHQILTLKTQKDTLKEFFKDKPVLFVGAGPSLSSNLDWIKQHQDVFIIVAMGAVYKKLFESGIRVDVVTSADAQHEVLDRTHFNEQDVKLLKDTMVIASISTPTKILNRFNQDKLFLFETYQALKSNTNVYNGASVGEVSLTILLDLEVFDIYMVGIDLAIDEKSGLTHYEGYENQRKVLDNIQADEVFAKGSKGLKDEFLSVKGLCKDKVTTSRVFALSIAKYEQLIAQFKQAHQSIYNLSTQAAFIHGVEFLDKKDIKLSSIKDKSVFDILKTHSEQGLQENEKATINQKIEALYKLLDFVQKNLEKNNTQNLPQFLGFVETLFKEILQTKDYIASNLLANYFKVMLPYVYESLNDEKIKPKIIGKKTAQAQQVFLQQIDALLKVYKNYLAQAIKE